MIFSIARIIDESLFSQLTNDQSVLPRRRLCNLLPSFVHTDLLMVSTVRVNSSMRSSRIHDTRIDILENSFRGYSCLPTRAFERWGRLDDLFQRRHRGLRSISSSDSILEHCQDRLPLGEQTRAPET